MSMRRVEVAETSTGDSVSIDGGSLVLTGDSTGSTGVTGSLSSAIIGVSLTGISLIASTVLSTNVKRKCQ